MNEISVLTAQEACDILSLQHIGEEEIVVMAQQTENVKMTASLKTHFTDLDNNGQDTALAILRSLEFAQNVICRQSEQAAEPKKKRVMDPYK